MTAAALGKLLTTVIVVGAMVVGLFLTLEAAVNWLYDILNRED